MPQDPQSTNIAKNLAYAKNAPASSFLDSVDIAEKAGSGDKYLAAAASRAFERRRERLAKDRRPLFDDATMRGLNTPQQPLGLKPTPGELAGIKGPIDAARMSVLQGLADQYARADELASIDEGTIKRQLIEEMQPTRDIDQRIKTLTKDGLVAKALISEELAKKGLSPAQRRAAVAQQMGVYQATIDNLLEIRNRRLGEIDKQVGEQVATMQRKEKAMQTRMDLLTKVGAELDKAGASREETALMELTITKARDEILRLRKTMGKSGVATRLGDVDSGPFTPAEVNAFDVMNELGIETAEDATGFLIDELSLSKEQVTNVTRRYATYRAQNAGPPPPQAANILPDDGRRMAPRI